MSKMCFSVLMSVYQKENPDYLDRALKSNLDDQTLQPDQFVLVCDGPLNPSLDAVIQKYEEKYPTIFETHRLEKNGGLGNALNYGLHFCKYELVARSDSDDVCLLDRFTKQITYMESHPEVSASSGTIDEFDTDYNHPKRVKHMPLSNEEILEYTKKRNPLSHMATIFRKSDVIEVGSYQQVQYLEDYYLWVRLLAAGKKLGNLDDLLVHVCVGNGMVERRGDKRYIEGWSMLDKYMIKHGMLSRGQYFINIGTLWIWCHMPGKVRDIIYKKILRN
ncbi:MAG: glycosyltransferase [Lachnospiraceae bacterium]|nr:glycosyltransferase [Lachnospiraceae bacterium]